MTDPSNEPVQVDSPLWRRLEMPIEGRCNECGHWTERRDYDNDIWLCESCNDELARGQEEDHRLDSPAHGQAADINKYRFEP